MLILILSLIILVLFIKLINYERNYLGETNSLKREIGNKEKEISKLKQEIIYLHDKVGY